MENKLSRLMNLVKHLPEECLYQAIETLENMKGEAEKKEEQKPPDCPHCRGKKVVRNGKRRGKQQYLCRHIWRGMREEFLPNDRYGAV